MDKEQTTVFIVLLVRIIDDGGCYDDMSELYAFRSSEDAYAFSAKTPGSRVEEVALS